MAKTTDELGALCVFVYMLMWAVWFTPFLLMVGLCWVVGFAYFLACNLHAWIEAVYYNLKDSWRD